MCRRVPALADARDPPGRPFRLGDKAIHQGGLAHSGVAQQGGDPVGQHGHHCVEPVAATGGDDLQVKVGELRGERPGRGEIGFGQAQNWLQAAGVGRDQGAFDQAGARRWVGQRDDDQ